MISDVLVNGESVGAVSEYTVSEIAGDVTIEASFEFSNYTQDNRFVFPTAAEWTTLEAEHFTLHNTGAKNEQYKLNIVNADWASNGKFVNAMNYGDQISLPYTAEAGTYEVIITYKSGSIYNKIEWSEESGKITANRASASASSITVIGRSTFNLQINESGEGVLIFTAPKENSPQIDKFEIRKLS